MQTATRGDTVQVHYRGTLDDGTVFDSSDGGDPIRFTVGEGEVIAGFENAIEGMAAGEKKTERIPPENAYGERNEELVFDVQRDQMPDNAQVAVGDVLEVEFPDGSSASVHVAAVNADSVTLDANHPLAGKALTFELELVAIG